MSVPGTTYHNSFSYVSAIDDWGGLLHLASHVASVDTASLFLQQGHDFIPVATCGTEVGAMEAAAQILPRVIDGDHSERVSMNPSLEDASVAQLASTLSGGPGFVSAHWIPVGGHICRMVLILAKRVSGMPLSKERLELIRDLGREIGIRMEAHLDRQKLESGLESLSALYLHLEKLGSTRCVGHCITTREGRLLSVSESLLTNLRLNRERVYERSFGDYFFFQPAFYEQQVGSSAAVISWKQLHYTTCTFQPDDGPSVRLAACSLQVPYPGELEAWNICLMREGDDVSAITGAENAPTILIAEDHPVNQRVIQGMVEKLGLRADVVSNGLEAVHAVCQKTYAAILMDCQMPEMDGVEATHFIRGNQESLGRIPIVAVTAVGQDDDCRRFLDAGVDEFMVKPIRMEELAEILERWTSSAAGSLEDSVGEVGPSLKRMDEALDRLRADLDADVVRDIVMLFFDDSKARLDRLSTVADAQGWEECRALAHTLKGSSSSLGATDLVEACEAFEAEKSTDPVVLRQRVSLIEQRFKEVVPMLRSYLDRLPAA